MSKGGISSFELPVAFSGGAATKELRECKAS